MTQILKNNIQDILKYKEKIFILLTLGIVVLSCSYLYLLHQTIANVVERGEIVRENRNISTTVAELESRYFSVKNSIDIDLAYARGFKDSEISFFVSKKSETAMVLKNEL